jgi:hypothetical protein
MSEYLLLAGSAFLGISTATILAVRSGQAVLNEAKTQLREAAPSRWFENEIQVGHVSLDWLASDIYTRGKSGE